MKKILSVIVAVVMLAATFSLAAFADTPDRAFPGVWGFADAYKFYDETGAEITPDPFNDGALRSVFRRNKDPGETEFFGFEHHRQNAGHRLDGAFKGKLPDEGTAVEIGGKLSVGTEDAEKDRQIIERTGFADVAGR